MDSTRTVTIVPLNEKNYATWKIQMKMYLVKEDLFSIIDGTETAPNGSADEKTRQKFASRRSKALASIVLAVDPKLLYLLGDPTDPIEVWKKLQATFQKKTWSNKFRLKKRLFNLKLEAGGELQAHLKTLTEIFEELAVVGDPVKDEDRVITLLSSLPDKFSTLVTALEAMETVPSWESVTERLLHEDAKSGKSDLSSSRCLAAQPTPNVIKKSFKCHECGKTGHLKKNCFQYLRKIENKANVVNNNPDPEIVLSADIDVNMCNINETWIIDSGASQHMTNNNKLFSKFVDLNHSIKVEIGDGRSLNASAIGNIDLKLAQANGGFIKCTLKNVLLVPELAHNLFSVSQCAKNGNVVSFNDDGCKVINADRIIGFGKRVGKLYTLQCITENTNISCNIADSDNETLWHRRFSHLNINSLRKLIKDELVTGIQCNVTDKPFFCVNCCDGKNHKLPFPNSVKKNLQPFELIHSDLCGSIKPMSLGGGNYFMSLIDDATRYCWIYILKNKSDVFSTFKNWKVMVEKQYNKQVKILRTDNGGEYCSKDIELFLQKEGIIHQKTIPKNPQQNGVAERLNRTLLESVRSMLSDSNLCKSFWAEAVTTAAYVRNRCPTSALGENVTPYEMLNGRKPNVSHLRVFGSKCFAHVPKDERDKLDVKSKNCVFVGYSSISKGYRVYDLNDKKLFMSRDVIFDELDLSSKGGPISNDNNVELPVDDLESDKHDITDSYPRKSSRVIRQPERYGEWAYSCNAFDEPSTVEEALNGPESFEWRKAMMNELQSIESHNVWNLVEPSADNKPIKTKWIFKKKLGSDNSVNVFKARLVAQGFSQKLGIDYEETFSPVVRFESLRALLSYAAQYNLEVHQMDVYSAFLNGTLNENIFVTQPEGFTVSGKEHLVCKLNKSLYGLKQSPKCWNDELDKYLRALNFKQLDSDPCMYINNNNNDELIILAIYVDDIVIASRSTEYIQKIKNDLNARYKMKDLGKLNHFLGVNVTQNERVISLDQSYYTEFILKKFGFNESKPVITPTDASVPLSKSTDDDKMFDAVTYQSSVGSLLYLSTKTRPDIAYAVSNVSKYCSKPTHRHWCAVKRIFRYLKGTMNLGISYQRFESDDCVGFSDADWAGDVSDRKSTSGYCFKFGRSLISWRSNKQTCVALSTAEAEYVALAGAAQEAVWLKHLLSGLSVNCDGPMVIYEDNQAAISLSKHNKSHPKVKHISIKYHFIRDLVDNGDIFVKYCPTDVMLADIFTKSLTAEKFVKLRSLLGMVTV